jgi:hypothetical protein
MSDIVKLILWLTWVAGIVLAKGFWWTCLAIILPLYSWYLVAEKIMILNGII